MDHRQFKIASRTEYNNLIFSQRYTVPAPVPPPGIEASILPLHAYGHPYYHIRSAFRSFRSAWTSFQISLESSVKRLNISKFKIIQNVGLIEKYLKDEEEYNLQRNKILFEEYKKYVSGKLVEYAVLYNRCPGRGLSCSRRPSKDHTCWQHSLDAETRRRGCY